MQSSTGYLAELVCVNKYTTHCFHTMRFVREPRNAHCKAAVRKLDQECCRCQAKRVKEAEGE